MNLFIRTVLAGASALALAVTPALAQVILPAEHVDLGIGFHNNDLELHWHIEDLGLEYEPHEAYAFIPLSSTFTRPAGTAWDFTGGTEGATIYVAPATDQTPDVLFLGLGSEEITPGTLAGNQVTLTLSGFNGPGQFSLWQTDPFQQPGALLSTFDNTTSFNLLTGGHDHYDWGFTAPGIYELTFTVEGVLDDGFATPVSDTATFTFAVGAPIPEPSAFAALAGLSALGLAATRRRRGHSIPHHGAHPTGA
jgi:surface-anchored protein